MFLREENIHGILKQYRCLSFEPRLPKVLVKCTNPHSLHVEVVVKLSKLWSETKNILWVSYCCKGSQFLEVTMFPAKLNTKKLFLFCINYFGKVISSEMFPQERNSVESWTSKQVFFYYRKSLRYLSCWTRLIILSKHEVGKLITWPGCHGLKSSTMVFPYQAFFVITACCNNWSWSNYALEGSFTCSR